jgi:hypothetical protein
MDDELKQYLIAMEERLKTHVDQRVEASEHWIKDRPNVFGDRLVEQMRLTQSALLREFERWTELR